jgi:hypothetical protein
MRRMKPAFCFVVTTLAMASASPALASVFEIRGPAKAGLYEGDVVRLKPDTTKVTLSG